MYTLFCPIDTTFDLSNSNADILIKNPSFPPDYVKNFPLGPLVSYAMSDNTGNILGFKLET